MKICVRFEYLNLKFFSFALNGDYFSWFPFYSCYIYLLCRHYMASTLTCGNILVHYLVVFFFFFLNDLYIEVCFFCMYVFATCICPVPIKPRRGHWILGLKLEMVVSCRDAWKTSALNCWTISLAFLVVFSDSLSVCLSLLGLEWPWTWNDLLALFPES